MVVVVLGHGQTAQDDVEAGGLGGVVPVVLEVGLVDDRRDPPQHRVGEVVAAQDGLEGAVVAVVAVLDAAHVERSGVRRVRRPGR